MKMRVVFGVYGFDQDTVKLQPWLTIREVGMRLAKMGWDIHVITDAVNKHSVLDGITIHKVTSLRQTNSSEIVKLILSINPDKIILLSSPLNLIGKGWFDKITCDIYAFLSYPFYSKYELIKAMPYLVKRDVIFYARYLLLPDILWRQTLKRYFKGLIAQSERTVTRVSSSTVTGLSRFNIQAGIDLDFWSPEPANNQSNNSVVRFLYVGSAKSIRGFDVLLSAFDRTGYPSAQLKILARGSDQEEEKQLRSYIDKRVKKRSADIILKGGWVDKELLRDEIRQADCVVLPFVLVPSELPVSVLECIACGTPVIATDINGLPEAIGTAGIIVKQANIKSLTEALNELCSSSELLSELSRQCKFQREKMLGWDDVAAQWMQALS